MGRKFTNFGSLKEICAEKAVSVIATTYTIPGGNGSEEKAEYRLAEVVVIGTFTDTNYIQMWFNDQPTEHIIVNAINTRETVTRQFKTIDLYVKEGTSIKFKLAA